MIRLIAILMGALAMTSCVTSGDLERRDAALSVWQQQTQQSLADLQAGVITEEEYERRSDDAWDDLEDELTAIKEDVQARTQAVAKTLTGPITGNPLVDLLGTVVVGAAGTYTAVNRARDKGRVQRGEATGVNATNPPTS
jgi:hypothetical protein